MLTCAAARSVAAVALLPGNTGLWGSEAVPAGTHTAEIINTANSRWAVQETDFLLTGVYPGYTCDIGCTIPYYVQQPSSTQYGFAPDVPAALPFQEGNSY